MPKDFQEDEEIYKKSSDKFKLFNYKIFAVIISLAIIYQAYILTYEETSYLQLPGLSYTIGAIVCGIMAIIVAGKFSHHEVFRKSYISLGIGFLLLALGQIIYLYYFHVLEIDAYPSMADVFFLSFSLFAGTHLIININYFKNKISNKTKVILPIIGISIMLTYSILSFNQIREINLDFFIGLLYAIEYAVLLPLVILGMIVSRKTILGATWLLLVIGMFFLGIADVWYTFVEFFEEFDFRHPTNTLWLFSYMVITFALIEHLTVISKKK